MSNKTCRKAINEAQSFLILPEVASHFSV